MQMKHMLKFAPALLALLGLLVGCSREERDWRNVKKLGTEDAYKQHAAAYPKGKHLEEAVSTSETLAWQRAYDTNTITSLEKFLATYPTSGRRKEAESRLEELRYTPSRDNLEACLREAIRVGAPGGPVGKGWTILVSIKSVGKYDKSAGYLRVEGMGTITDGHNQYYVIPDHFRVTTDGKGSWRAQYLEKWQVK